MNMQRAWAEQLSGCFALVSQLSGMWEEVALWFYDLSGFLNQINFYRVCEKKETTRLCGHTLKSSLRMRKFDRR
jgi:hypothetical protein